MFKRALYFVLVLIGANSAFSQIYINEFLASNISATVDSSDYLTTSDWIELYNAGPEEVNLEGYSLSDNSNETKKWVIPPGVIIPPNGYFLFWADGKNKKPGDTDIIIYSDTTTITVSDYHLSFKLSSNGEFIGLYSLTGEVIDSIRFGKQIANISYGRTLNDMASFEFLAEPTPKKSNFAIHSPTFTTIEAASLSVTGGKYAMAQTLTMSSHSATAKIHYTTDGSRPTSTSRLYVDPVAINYTQTIRCRVFENDKLPSEIVTETFLIGENIGLPIIAISANYADLYGFDFGIFKNSLKNREVAASIEYFSPSGTKEFGLDAGMKIFGSTIFQLQQKPMSIRMKGKYGTDELAYQLFDNKAVFNFKNFVLRNGGNDNGQTLFADGLVTSLVADQMDIDYQSYKPAVVFVNGQFWGIYNLREKLNDNYLVSNHHLNSTHLNILEDNASVNQGSPTDYMALLDFVKNNDLSVQANYKYVESRLDINEYINYKITKMYIGYWLADLNNKYWNSTSPHQKWRWILFDLEHSFGNNGSDNCTENTLAKIASIHNDLPEWSTVLLTNLMDNEAFKNEFIQRSASYLNTLFKSDNVIKMIDRLSTTLVPELPRHISKWNSDPLAIQSMGVWRANVNALKAYAQCRPDEVKGHIMDYFAISDTFTVTIRIPQADTGKILINNVLITDTVFTGSYFSGIPLTITAVPKLGYRFSSWLNGSTNDTLVLSLTQDTILTPLFIVNPTENVLPGHISSNTILTQIESPYYAAQDLVIDSNTTLTMEAGAELLMSDGCNIIVYGNLITNGNHINKSIIRSNSSVRGRIPVYNPSPRWGALCVTHATDTTKLNNLIISNTSFGKDPSIHKGGISAYHSNLLIDSIEIIDSYQPFYSEYGMISIQNSTLNTHLSTDVINIKYADSALVKGCTIKGNNAEDTDAIDFDQIARGAITDNRIYSFLGENSDGIDLGEASTNILIARNSIFNCSDKGISIGQASTAHVHHNIIYNCAQGIGIKDSNSFAYIDHNTFFQNDYAIASFEKNLGQGGGNAHIQNSILSNSNIAPFLVDGLSSLTIDYSLSNTLDITQAGTGNLFDDPLFIHAGLRNFQLQANSPCIDMGDPLSPRDADNSVTDMGAYDITWQADTVNTIVINEINYNSMNTLNSGDWIELYNYGEHTVDLSDWVFMNKNYTVSYTIDQHTQILPNQFLIICKDTNLFNIQFPSSNRKTGNFIFDLEPTDQLRLFNADMELVCMVAYTNSGLWFSQADGRGCSLELDSTHLNHSLLENWHQSNSTGGTPGLQNSDPQPLTNLFINELMASNTVTYTNNFGEYEDWIEIYNGNPVSVDVGGLYVTDNLDKKMLWQIPRSYPDSTTIQPYGHLVLSADKNPGQGVLHLNFKLKKSGEAIGLSQLVERDNVLLDSIIFGNQEENSAFGRYPDGSVDWSHLYPTPNATNVLFEPISLNNLRLYPNPANTQVNIEINGAIDETARIELINLSGQMVLNKDIDFVFNQTVQHLDLSGVRNGIYFVQVRLGNQVKVGKLIVLH